MQITCTGAEMIRLDELHDFQGNLKDLTQPHVEKLLKHMEEDGFSYPFFYWQDKTGKKWIFDGHQRLRVLGYAKEHGKQIPGTYPACRIEAKDKNDAARKLLNFICVIIS